MSTQNPTPAPQTIAQVCGTTEEAWRGHLKRPTPDDYAGLSKQEVAERLKNPTPDATATATPRTDKAIVVFHHCAGVDIELARTLERELTAAKAEIAYVREESATREHFKGEAYKIADTWKARAERAEAQLRERTQWQCKCGGTDCAGQAENERLLAEVEAMRSVYLKGCDCAPGEACAFAVERDQLRARVAALEQDKARLDLMEANAAEVRVEWDDGEAPIPPEFSIVVRGTGVIGRGPTLRSAIDAARAGKGAT